MSILYLHWLRFSDVTHVGSRFQRLERLEMTVRLRNLNVWRHVRVWTRECSRLYSVRRQGLLQLLPLDSLHSIVVSSGLISEFLLPLSISVVCWSDTVLHSLDSLLKSYFLLLFLLLQFKSFTLEHGELRNCSKHLSWEFGGSCLVFVDFLSDFQSALSSIESLGSQLFSQVADFFVNKFLLEERLFLVVESLFKNLNLGLQSFWISIFSLKLSLLWMLLRVLQLTG